MKKRRYLTALTCIPLIALSSCANYKASSLNSLSSETISTPSKNGDVSIVAKAFDKADCKKYLDRDVISQGYQPIQLYIQNNSNKNYNFSLDRINLACARSDEVAQTVHTSTVGRVVGYTAAAMLTCGIFFIPAIVDGVKSSQANESLDNDFAAKTAHNQVIHPYSSFNKILFVPTNQYQNNLSITLVNMESNQPESFNIFIN